MKLLEELLLLLGSALVKDNLSVTDITASLGIVFCDYELDLLTVVLGQILFVGI